MAEVGCPSEIDLFRDLPDSCLDALERDSRIVDFDAGHQFFGQGQPGETLFLLEKGVVRTFRNCREKKITIAIHRAPAVFGETGCFGKGTYHCSAESVQASRVRLISRNSIEALLKCSPNLARGLINLMSERFARFLHDFESHALKGTIPRLARLLLERAQGDAVRGLTHKDIAGDLGVHRESVSAALGELRRAGIISTARKEIRILEPSRLERATRE